MTGTGRQQAKQLYVKVGDKSAKIKANITTYIAICVLFFKQTLSFEFILMQNKLLKHDTFWHQSFLLQYMQ